MKKEEIEALKMAKRFQVTPSFETSLEFLLHNALKDAMKTTKKQPQPSITQKQTPQTTPTQARLPTSPKQPTTTTTTTTAPTQTQTSLEPLQRLQPSPELEFLKEAHDFIEKFPRVYLQVLVRCTRKMDTDTWPILYSITPRVTELFKVCLLFKVTEWTEGEESEGRRVKIKG